MSSSVTIDWRAVRERERQACLALRAELAQLQAREKQLQLRNAALGATRGLRKAEIQHIRRPANSANSAELRRLVSEARDGLARSSAALDEAISAASRTGPPATSAEWSMRSGPELASPGRPVAMAQPGSVSRDPAWQPAAPVQETGTALLVEADEVIEECRLRCPETDLHELTRLRARMGTSQLADRATVHDLRVVAGQTIKKVKRADELEALRQRLFVLAEDAREGERALLRRRVADAPPDDLPGLDQEVSAAVQRASAQRAQAEAVTALQASLRELNYEIQGGFGSLLPSSAAAGSTRSDQPAATFVVAASPHSPQHGLRIRAGDGQLFVSVVRQAGTGEGSDTRVVDTEVQQRTCQDLERATAAANAGGIELVLGNAQDPGQLAPELPARYWPSAVSADGGQEATAESGKKQEEERRRQAWAAQEQRRITAQQAQARRPL